MDTATERFVIAVTRAEYAGGFMLRVAFSDGTTQSVDFEPFLRSARNPAIRDFLDTEKFKRFKVEEGDLMWGDYEPCFPIADLYHGKIA